MDDITKSAFGAILHKKWVPAEEEYKIIGFWAEDNSRYYIECPKQLRSLLINIQNWLADKYIKIEKSKQFVTNTSMFFNGLKEEERR